MATDADLLKGVVEENPTLECVDVEKLLMGFLSALLTEQGLNEARIEVGPVPPYDMIAAGAIANG